MQQDILNVDMIIKEMKKNQDILFDYLDDILDTKKERKDDDKV